MSQDRHTVFDECYADRDHIGDVDIRVEFVGRKSVPMPKKEVGGDSDIDEDEN